jgi:hypothetical protein
LPWKPTVPSVTWSGVDGDRGTSLEETVVAETIRHRCGVSSPGHCSRKVQPLVTPGVTQGWDHGHRLGSAPHKLSRPSTGRCAAVAGYPLAPRRRPLPEVHASGTGHRSPPRRRVDHGARESDHGSWFDADDSVSNGEGRATFISMSC